MSPEEAQGKPVDTRSDIFSFGAVLYEMVTGQRAFARDSAASTLAAVLREAPPSVAQVIADTPRDLEEIIPRCLRKDPARRFQGMADVKVALDELNEESESGTLAAAAPPPPRGPRRILVWAASALAVVLVPFQTKATCLPSGDKADPHWTSGRSIVFGSARAGASSLWRVALSGGDLERLPFRSDNGQGPSLSRKGGRLACARRYFRGPGDGMAVSLDERSILYEHPDHNESQIVLVENFQ